MRVVFYLICLSLVACESGPPKSVSSYPASYAVPDRHSAKTVEEVLRAGGNAVDASIAAAFVLAVTLPEAGNIGGGGFMLARMDKENHFLDYREKAPLKAYRNMYLDEEGNPIEKSSLVGIRAAGVPGTVAGMWEVHQEFATMSWSELLAPAIKYAREGFVVHEKTAASIPATIEWFGGKVNFADYFGDLAKAENFKQPVLAETLERIAKSGPKDFYQGRTAKMIVAQSEQDGGLITQADLSEYQAVWRAPIEANWRDYQVITAPPPSSGGFAIVQLLKMKELLDAEFADLEVNTPQYIHLVAEMEKRVFADRAEYFGDPDFVDVPLAELISDAYIKKRTSEVNTRSISQISDAQPGLESPNTTHFSIVDKWGNAVANTYTINWEYGSGVVVEGAGFILNNEMDDFSVKPGVGNIYGVVGGTANEIQGGKRMLSSMSPTLLINEDEVELVLGTPGGSTIFTTVFQAIVNVVDYDMPPETVVGMSRFHHQLLPPDLITTSVSKPLPQRTIKELNSMGYRVEPHAWEYGDLQLIHRTYNESRPASDPRGIGVSGVVR